MLAAVSSSRKERTSAGERKTPAKRSKRPIFNISYHKAILAPNTDPVGDIFGRQIEPNVDRNYDDDDGDGGVNGETYEVRTELTTQTPKLPRLRRMFKLRHEFTRTCLNWICVKHGKEENQEGEG